MGMNTSETDSVLPPARTENHAYSIGLGLLLGGVLIAAGFFFLRSGYQPDTARTKIEVTEEPVPSDTQTTDEYVPLSEMALQPSAATSTEPESTNEGGLPPQAESVSDIAIRDTGISLRPLPTDTFYKTENLRLSDFKKAENRWFENYNLGAKDIPRNTYRALYFDSTKPKNIVRNVVTDKIAVNYAWAEGDGFTVDSPNFGGFWVGDIDITERGVYTVTSVVSQSEARIIINGYEVLTEGVVDIDLDPGVYRVEVEYLNNWHTTDFSVNLKRKETVYNGDQVFGKVRAIGGDVAVWYVGAYESANADRVIHLEIGKSPIPVVLILSAYSQVYWDIDNQNGTNIAYVLYDGGRLGSTVTGSVPSERVLQIEEGRFQGAYTLAANCSEIGSSFYCENIDGLTHVDAQAEVFTGKKITGFSGAYSVGSALVPEQRIDASERAKILKSYDDMRANQEHFESTQTIQGLF
jgi:hypothetical protein